MSPKESFLDLLKITASGRWIPDDDAQIKGFICAANLIRNLGLHGWTIRNQKFLDKMQIFGEATGDHFVAEILSVILKEYYV